MADVAVVGVAESLARVWGGAERVGELVRVCGSWVGDGGSQSRTSVEPLSTSHEHEKNRLKRRTYTSRSASSNLFFNASNTLAVRRFVMGFGEPPKTQ